MFYKKCVASRLTSVEGKDLSNRFVNSISAPDLDFFTSVGDFYLILGVYMDGANVMYVATPASGLREIESLPALLFEKAATEVSNLFLQVDYESGDMLITPQHHLTDKRWFEKYINDDESTIESAKEYVRWFIAAYPLA